MIEDADGSMRKVKANEMVAIGYEIDCDAKAKYAFDFVFRMGYDKRKQHWYAEVVKTRSDKWKIGDIIVNPSWDTIKDVIDNCVFVPSQTEEEARARGRRGRRAPRSDQ